MTTTKYNSYINVDYEPVQFLRCHSKNKDNADVQTQVWHCAFKPSFSEEDEYHNTVATCGGNSICFIDCSSGVVLAKYYTPDPSIILFTLAWTTLRIKGQTKDILVSGGTKNGLYFIDFSKKTYLLENPLRRTTNQRTESIQSLLFHQTDRQILFCGLSRAKILICEFLLDEEDGARLVVLSTVKTDNQDLIDMTFCLTSKFLLAACEGNIHGFSFTSSKALRLSHHVNNSIAIEVFSKHKKPGNSSDVGGLIDSIEVLENGLVACKYALHGSIYICDLKPLRIKYDESRKLVSYSCEPLYVFLWSDTDNYFMHMGLNLQAGLLGCGDDRGSIWLYDLKMLQSVDLPDSCLSPNMILQWPEVIDHYNDKKRKLKLDVYDILIDKVAIHSSGYFIVSVTNNNLVCIWRRICD